jgi:DNA-binding beta-propeller fold protein YncE
VDGLDGAAKVAISPDGRQVVVTGRSENAIAVFDRNVTTGDLMFRTSFKDNRAGVDGLGGAFGLDISADGQQVFVAGPNDNAIAVFDRNATTGDFTFRTALQNGQNGVEGLGGVSDVAVSPNGQTVYAAAQVDAASAIFDRDSLRERSPFKARLAMLP